MNIFQRMKEKRLVTHAIRQIAAGRIHQILGTLSRVQPLPEEFPPLSSDAENCDKIAKLAEKVTHDDRYWEQAPSLIPLPDDTIEAIAEMSGSNQPRKKDMVRKMFAAGVDKDTVRIALTRLLEHYKSGKMGTLPGRFGND